MRRRSASPAGPDRDDAPRSGPVRLMLPAVWVYLRAAPALFAVRLVAVAVSGLGPVAIAVFTKQIIDRLVTHRGAVAVPAAALAVSTAVLALTQHVTAYADRELGRRVTRLTSARLFAAVNRPVGIGHLEDPRYHDRVRLAQQAAQTGPQQLTQALLGILQAGFTIAGFLTTLLAVSVLASAMVLASVVPLLLAQLRLAQLRAGTQMRISPHIRRQLSYSMLMLDIRAAKEIRLFGLGAVLERRMLDELGVAQRGERSVDRAVLGVDSAGALLTGLVSGAALIVVVSGIASGHGTVGDLSILIGALGGIQGAIAGVIAQLAAANLVLIMFSHYHGLTQPRRPTAGGGGQEGAEPCAPVATGPDGGARVPASVAAGRLRERIEFRDVWFRYHPDHDWVLRGVDLTLEAGTSVALVGLNGAGKSTLVKLLCRMYEPTRGRITWDGTDLADLDVAAVRARVGVLFQDFMNYDLTAHENIAVGDVRMLARPCPEDVDLVRQAARVAGADEAISALPQGYGTMLSRLFLPGLSGAPSRSNGNGGAANRAGDGNGSGSEASGGTRRTADRAGGTLLSGGQWQRVALARAVLRQQADLLILDEPSSGLDAEAERDIHARLVELRKGRTSLLISHRLSTVRDADQIVVLGSGRVAEQGSHHELMSLDGVYAALFRAQASGYQLDSGLDGGLDSGPDGAGRRRADRSAAAGKGHPALRVGATAFGTEDET